MKKMWMEGEVEGEEERWIKERCWEHIFFFFISAIYTMVHSLSIIQVAAHTSTNNNQVYVINPRYRTHDCYVYITVVSITMMSITVMSMHITSMWMLLKFILKAISELKPKLFQQRSQMEVYLEIFPKKSYKNLQWILHYQPC